MILLVHGGRVIDPGRGIDRVGDVLITEGRIVHVGGPIADSPPLSAVLSRAQRLDARGLIVCPGFIDLHCHLREPGFEEKETIATGTEAAARGGFTAICCMANTKPPLDTPPAIADIRRRIARDALVTVLPVGCITRGRIGEELTDMRALAEAGVIAFSDDGDPVTSSQIMREAMSRGLRLGLPIIDHCEDRALSSCGVLNEGRVSVETGLPGIPAAAEEIIVARDLILAKLTGARLHIAHVSTGSSVTLIRQAKKEGIAVTAEVTPHHLTLTEDSVWRDFENKGLDTDAKVNPPLRTKADVDALIEGLNDGVIDAIATDHAPHTVADKTCDFRLAAFGISGFETAFGCLMDLVHRGHISLTRLLSELTCGPAGVIDREGVLGTLKAGTAANITILDLDHAWTVDASSFASMGRNTPYHGHSFRGKVMATIASGRTVYMDDLLRPRLATASDHPPLPSSHPDTTSCHSEPASYDSEGSEESHG